MLGVQSEEQSPRIVGVSESYDKVSEPCWFIVQCCQFWWKAAYGHMSWSLSPESLGITHAEQWEDYALCCKFDGRSVLDVLRSDLVAVNMLITCLFHFHSVVNAYVHSEALRAFWF